MHIPPTFQTAGPFGIGGGELVLLIDALLGMMIVPLIFYILTLKSAIEKCAPENQAMPPSQIWLLLIPVFNLGWHFYVVGNMAKSLGEEFRRGGIGGEPEPAKSLGIAMCIVHACILAPPVGFLAWLAGPICWILYWVKISDYSRRLSASPAVYYGEPGQLPPVRR